MKAAVISELGRLPELADRPEPSGEAIYELSAVSLNPVDVNVGAGRYFAGHPALPYVPGCEGVGRASNGTRVYLFGGGLGLSRDGLLAERAAAPADLGIPLPDAVSDEVAASCGIAGMAGWMPVAWRAPVRNDDCVLVLGPTNMVDTLWGAPAVAATQAAAPGWRLVQIGQSAGAEAPLASAAIRGKMG